MKQCANWVINEVRPRTKRAHLPTRDMASCPVSPVALRVLITLVVDGVVTRKVARQTLDVLFGLTP